MLFRAFFRILFTIASFWTAYAAAQTVTLTADVPGAPAHSLVHLSAALPAPGTVLFADNGAPIATVTTATRLAVLGTASFAAGPHLFTATLISPGSAGISSAPLPFTVSPAAAGFTVAAGAQTAYVRAPVSLFVQGLPPTATGRITYSESGSPLADGSSTGTLVPAYNAFGDSITSGFGLTDPAQAFPFLFAASRGLSPVNYDYPGAIACDLFPLSIARYQLGPAQAVSPLYSVMIGTNDADWFGPGAHEANYEACSQAALAWLGIPREFKVLPGDPGATILSGQWAQNPTDQNTFWSLYNDTGTGAASFTLTSNGGPLYLWQLISDTLAGTFTLAVDGVPIGTIYSTTPPVPIQSHQNPASSGFALLRFPVPPGVHVIQVTALSGTTGILGIGTAPSPGAIALHPTVLAGEIPNQLQANPIAAPATLAQYNQDLLADINLLQADGLDVRSVPTQSFLTGDPSEMADQTHPNLLGHQHLGAAFTAAFASSALDLYLLLTHPNPAGSASVSFAQPGTHTIIATYSGDDAYAPSTATITLNILPLNPSAVTLATPATEVFAGVPTPFTANLTPASATGSLRLWDGTQLLAAAPALNGAAAFSVPDLSPGLHSLTLTYAGDAADEPSASPALMIQVLRQNTSLTLSPGSTSVSAADQLTLNVTSSPASAGGTILVFDSYDPAASSPVLASQPVAHATLVAGSAVVTVPSLLPGTHTFTATYAGDTNDQPATSAEVAVIISLIPTSTNLSQPPNQQYGDTTTVTASVSPQSAGAAVATGSITFHDSLPSPAGPLAPFPLINGKASFTSASLAPGTHTFTASYSGDALHAASTSPAVSLSIAQRTATVTLSASVISLTAGSPLTVTALVSPMNATGSILLSDPVFGTLAEQNVTSGAATFLLPSLAVGSYRLTATYLGDSFTLPSSSAVFPVQITAIPASVVLSAPSTGTWSVPVTLSASFTPASLNGTIRFADNGTLLDSVPLSQGIANLTLSTLSPGTHTLTAIFPGDATHASATATTLTSMFQATSTTSLTLAQISVVAGAPLLVNVRVATLSTATPTGTVTVRAVPASSSGSGPTLLVSGSLANAGNGIAYATLAVPTNAAGAFSIAAFYSGDANIAPSDSSGAPASFTASLSATSATLTLSSSQVPPQTPISLTAVFTNPSAPATIPTGSATFYLGASAMETIPLDAAGRASFTLPARAIGAYSLTAVLNPTGFFATSTSPPQSLTVTPPLTLVLTPNALNVNVGGGSGASTLMLTPLSGFQGTVAVSCTSPQAWITCTLDPVTSLSAPTSANVHISVAPNTLLAASTPALRQIQIDRRSATLALLLPFLSLLRRTRRPNRRRFSPLLSLLLATFVLSLNGCATGGDFGQLPSGPQILNAKATAAGTTLTTTLTVTIP